MPVQLEPGTPLHVTLRHAILAECARARQQLEGRGAVTDDALHETRKHIKRARALLRLLDSKQIAPAQAELRLAARALGPAREEAAELECLRELGEHPVAAGLREPIGELVEGWQAARVIAPGSVAFEQAVTLSLAELSRGVARLESCWPREAGLALLLQGLKKTYAQARRALGRARVEPSLEHWHALRRCAKAQFYQLPLLEPLWPVQLAASRKELDSLGKRLGEHHDLALLVQRLSQRGAPASVVSELGQRIALRLAELESLALGLARRMYAERPRAFAARHAEYYAAWLSEQRSLADR